MPLKILRQKAWNIWNKENREIILRDERVKKEEEDTKNDLKRKRDFEKKIELLKSKAKTNNIDKIDIPEQPPPKLIKNEIINIKKESNIPIESNEIDNSKVSTPPLTPTNSKEIIPSISLEENGHFNLFKNEDDFLMILGKTNNKKDVPENRYKTPELPGNKDYEAELRQEEYMNLKREGVAPLGLGQSSKDLQHTPWDKKDEKMAIGRNGKVLTGERAERFNKREENRMKYYDPVTVLLYIYLVNKIRNK